MAGTSPRSMLSAVIIFFSCTLTSIVLGVFGGSVVDIIDYQFRSMGWFQGNTWGTFAGYDFALNLFYAFPYIIELIGLYVLFSTIYHRYGRDQNNQPDDEEDIYLIEGGRI